MLRNAPFIALAAGTLLLLQNPAPCAALQNRLPAPSETAGSIAALSVNTFAGALTAAVRSLFEDRSNLPRAVVKGALGGGVSYLGKRVAVESWTAAPLVGRVIHAAGASLVAQAAVPTGNLLDSLQFLIGPVSLHLSLDRRPGISVNAREVLVLASAFAMNDLHFDREYSLKALTPVFRTRHTRIRSGDRFTSGTTVGHAIVLDGLFVDQGDAAFPHEVVHLLQFDFLLVAWDQPLERALRSRVPGTGWVPRWLHVGAMVPGLWMIDDEVNNGRGYMYRLLQAEAAWLERHH